MILVAAQLARQVLRQQLQRQHIVRLVADAQARDQSDVPRRSVGGGRCRCPDQLGLRGDAGQADILDVELAALADLASHSNDGSRHEDLVGERWWEPERKSPVLVLEQDGIALGAILAA